jgi:hypothetical protein
MMATRRRRTMVARIQSRRKHGHGRAMLITLPLAAVLVGGLWLGLRHHQSNGMHMEQEESPEIEASASDDLEG